MRQSKQNMFSMLKNVSVIFLFIFETSTYLFVFTYFCSFLIAPSNVTVTGNLEVRKGNTFEISCSYGLAIPEITKVKYCVDDFCSIRPIVSLLPSFSKIQLIILLFLILYTLLFISGLFKIKL